ncbi:prolyl oligopeptidase family serine peptidase [Thermaurantiacus tibetensis]|uniref:S9 family peptidase n=1 Tax=Thermaurantiacus tibetensis TaxID=2759035 RepID=UPI0018901DF9|nr:prolyl oligopeptidase family serine peptidase [Thermaurantiacus tibetensis]
MLHIRRPVALLAALLLAGPAIARDLPPPPALRLDGVPQVPAALAERVRPWMEFRTASFQGWDPATRGMLITTRFGDSNQLHLVAGPGAARRQLSFEPEPVAGGSFAPGTAGGDVLLAAADVGGAENFQLFRLAEGRMQLLTDGKSRNTGATWSKDGRLVGFASNARNGRDTDLWVMDPRDPASRRLVAERQGGGWAFLDFFPGGRSALVARYVSIEQSELHRLDLETGLVTPVTRDRGNVSYGGARVTPDGRILATSDRFGEFRALGVVDPATGVFTRLGAPARWDVEEFAVSADGARVAVVTNEAGISRLRVLDSRTGALLLEPEVPVGVISGVEFAPWGELGFTLSSARSPGDGWSLTPEGALRRWTFSETGGLDPARNVEPELVRVKSFDGREVTGFLYRPDPAQFPGPRPLLVNIHGGPEAQSRPGFQGRNNYLLNARGIAIFYPNVRGSTGFGKTFVSLDNGPWKREDSVRDIEAMVRHLARDGGIDGSRIGVTGGSYGGYMTYAALTLYPRLWRAGLAVVAISDFVTFLENTADYRRDLRRVEYGDETDPKQRAKLKEISPLGRADRIAVPLMVVTGANDPRVPASEADQMVAAVRANGREAWHLVAANEGHGFRRKENQDYQFWTSLLFWERHLLGD